VIVTLDHYRSIPGFSPRDGFCASGGRRFFEQHGLDWAAFRRAGIDSQALLATEDALAIALVRWAEQVEAGNGQ
jgi:hypothetical protein